ncbi:MAG: hypothetical protein Q9187_001396 [Circinaria calcarea]
MAEVSMERDKSYKALAVEDDTMSEPTTAEALTTRVVPHYPSGWKLAVIILPLCLGILLVALDNTIIAVAIPEIATTFKSLTDVGWYGSGYLLTVTAFQPILGKFYTYFNMKATYLVSVIIFEVGSILCASAPNSPVFIVGRVIAGIGAAGLFQGALSIVAVSVPLTKRPLYLGIVASSFGIATCFGPILGGVFTTDISWRWCFWINLPIGAIVFFLVLIFLKLHGVDTEDRSLAWRNKIRHMDLGGAITLIAAVSCLLLALQWGGNIYPWASSRIIGLFTGFGGLMIVFSILQWNLKEKAAVPPQFLRQRTVVMGCFYTFFISISNYTAGFYLPFYFQAVQGVSATRSGIDFIALALPEVFAILIAGAIANRTGHYVELMVIGAIIGSIGAGLLTRISLTSSTVEWAAYMVITGFGIGLGTNLPYTALQAVLSAVAIPVGNALLLGGLTTEIPRQTKAVSPEKVIDAGTGALTVLAQNPEVLRALRLSYLVAVKYSLYLAVASVAIAVPLAVGLEWKTLKTAIQEQKGVDNSECEEKRIRED